MCAGVLSPCIGAPLELVSPVTVARGAFLVFEGPLTFGRPVRPRRGRKSQLFLACCF